MDVSQGVPGPFCARLLADVGADVVKIERPLVGDCSRRAGPFPGDKPDTEQSGLFAYLNRGKRSITLDLESNAGRRLFQELLERYDVVIEGFRPSTARRLGMEYGELGRTNTRLILMSIKAFGSTGPYRDYRASSLVLEAMGGPLMHATGLPDREPLKFAGRVRLFYAGMMAATATTAAVYHRLCTGAGKHVEMSITQALMNAPEIVSPIDSQYTGMPFGRPDPDVWSDYLVGCYPCKDGYVAIQGRGRGDEWWNRVFDMLGQSSLKDDVRFNTREGRRENNGELMAYVYSWLADRTRAEVFAAAREFRFPLAPVYNAEDMVGDPHFGQRGMWETARLQDGPVFRMPSPPFNFVGHKPGAEHAPSPKLGEHNAEVYGALGYASARLRALRQDGVI